LVEHASSVGDSEGGVLDGVTVGQTDCTRNFLLVNIDALLWHHRETFLWVLEGYYGKLCKEGGVILIKNVLLHSHTTSLGVEEYLVLPVEEDVVYTCSIGHFSSAHRLREVG